MILMIVSFSIAPAVAYEEETIEQVMNELKNSNLALFKKANKIYKYAMINTNEIINKPLLTKHNKALNGFLDRENKVSAKFFASGTEGIKAKFVMLFKFNGKKYGILGQLMDS